MSSTVTSGTSTGTPAPASASTATPEPKKPEGTPQDIGEWLGGVGLGQYESKFRELGASDVSDLGDLDKVCVIIFRGVGRLPDDPFFFFALA